MPETSGQINDSMPPQIGELGEPEVHLRILSQPKYLAGARDLIDAIARRMGFDELNAGQIALAVDEALTNVIRHGYDKREDCPIWLSIWPTQNDRRGLHMVIEDEAKQVDPAIIRSRDLEEVRPGGLGVYLIQQIMDASRWERREEKGMRLLMTKYVADTAGGSAPEHPKDTQSEV